MATVQRSLDVRWTGTPTRTGLYREPKYGAPAFFAQWDERVAAPKLQVINVIMTRNRNVDLTRPGETHFVPREELDLYLQSTAHIPLDGIVIVKGPATHKALEQEVF